MDLFQRLLECKEEEVDSIVEEAIRNCNNSDSNVETLGFLGQGQANNVFKGFIPLKTRIKYANLNMEDYGMETTDFMHEIAHIVKKYNINNKASLIYNLESFINSYFGYPGKMEREYVFNDIAWQSTTSDEEYFEALKNNKIGDLKGMGAAMCTERSAVAQQILSLFGIESYYCMGCINEGEKEESHCFNIVKRKNDYALLDYSVPVASYNPEGRLTAYYPFVGTLSNEEFMDFINNGTIKSFDDYYMTGKTSQKTGKERLYVVGKYTIDNNKSM